MIKLLQELTQTRSKVNQILWFVLHAQKFHKPIKVFEFNSEILNQLQQLDGHSSNVSCLEFMKNTNTFVSGSRDKTIKIWIYQEVNKWNPTQILQAHTGRVNCKKTTFSSDQIISGGEDKCIRFWSLNDLNWGNSQTISVSHQGIIYGLNLNEQEKKLIYLLWESEYSIIEQVLKNQWSLSQKLIHSLATDYASQQIIYLLFSQIVLEKQESTNVALQKKSLRRAKSFKLKKQKYKLF